MNLQKTSLPVFSLTLFISAALMFAVQPMVGKMLLPLVGGAPSGWIVAMAFFQVMLLLGYLLADILSGLSPRKHALLFIVLLGIGISFLPISFGNKESIDGPGSVFFLLFLCIGAPFIALSTTSSTMQRLFASTDHFSAQDPYFLYAASNLGSFAGLLLYPFVIERYWGLIQQSHYWLYGYAGLIGLALLCVLQASQKNKPFERKKTLSEPITLRQQASWILLSFIPSSLLFGVTTHISTDIFSAPLIWIWPLSLYLLTFVVAFSSKSSSVLKISSALHPASISASLFLLLVYDIDLITSWAAFITHLFCFAIVALMCHARLFSIRPENVGHLTRFYLMISIGGALGGIINAFVVPNILDRLIEYPAIMIFSCLVHPAFQRNLNLWNKSAFALALVAAGIYGLYMSGHIETIFGLQKNAVIAGLVFSDIILAVIFLLLTTNVRVVFIGSLVLLFLTEFILPKDVVFTKRNFYGTIKIIDQPMFIDGEARNVRYLYHGTTMHGMQILDPAYIRVTTSYYYGSPQSPLGAIFTLYKPKDVAVVGLGAGTLKCFSSPDRAFTFIEIDPAIVSVAQNQFDFLAACGNNHPLEMIVGDGRLEMKKLEGRSFDLIVLDAFSADTVPTHLLTLEAIKIYMERLRPDGLLAFHISNRYFYLGPPLAKAAEEIGLKARFVFDNIYARNDYPPYAAPSGWIVMSRRDAAVAFLDNAGWVNPSLVTDYGWKDLEPWTDDHTNLMQALIP